MKERKVTTEMKERMRENEEWDRKNFTNSYQSKKASLFGMKTTFNIICVSV